MQNYRSCIYGGNNALDHLDGHLEIHSAAPNIRNLIRAVHKRESESLTAPLVSWSYGLSRDEWNVSPRVVTRNIIAFD